MQNIKNFTTTNPTKSQVLKSKNVDNTTTMFLKSEDGIDWYESQKLFKDDTIKIMYDSDNVIRSLISSPIPQRGNTLNVNMFFPINMSVAEVDRANFPLECSLDGTWKFIDGVVFQDEVVVISRVLATMTRQKKDLIQNAVTKIILQQAGIASGYTTEQLNKYLVSISNLTDSEMTSPSFSFPDL